MVACGLFVVYAVASVAWLTALFVSPQLGVLLGVFATYGFLRVAQDVEAWNRQKRHISYELAALASRGYAVAAAALALGVAPLLAHQIPPLEAWGVRFVLYVMWTGLWMLYYYVFQVRLENLGKSPGRYPLTTAALSLNTLLSPVLTEGLPAPPEVKLALAASMYAGYMPPLNVSTLLAALVARR